MRRLATLLIALMMVSIPYSQVLGWTGTGHDRGPGPLAEGDPWSDSFDDMGQVYVPPGGLVGVEVLGGEVRLLAGHDEGWVASTEIACPEGYRYDLVLLDAITPGNSSLNITILDPSKPPDSTAFANATVPGFVNMTGTDESVFRVDYVKYPTIRIQVTLLADGDDSPRLRGWGLLFIPLGEWRDEFLGTGKMTAHSGLAMTGGELELDLTGSGSGASYDPYPPVLFPDDQGDVDVFYPTASNDGYQNDDTITGTASVQGLAFGDLDDDGYMDLVLAAGGNSNSMILWGSSSGTWSTSDKTSLAHKDSGTDAAVGDFNGDGHLDVVIAAEGGMINDGSYVYLNNGDGTFDLDWDIKLDGATSYVDTGDLNGDGYDDIVFVKSMVMAAIGFYGSPTGPGTIVNFTFLNYMPMTGRGDLKIEDIDADGYLDVLFATVNNSQAPVYLGSSSGVDNTVDYSLRLKGLPREVDVGDINNDGYLDIAYCTFDSTGSNALIEIFKGTSTGWSVSDKHEIVTQSKTPNAMEVIDIDTDGYEDIVLGDSTTFYLYKGGSTWPTASSMTKTGLGDPYDVAVVASQDGGGGAYRGSFMSDPIPLPTRMMWDVLHVAGDVPEGTSISVSVLDSNKVLIPGYTELAQSVVDLSNIVSLREIYVKVDIESENNLTTPVLESLMVNWHDKMVWRDQFYGGYKAQSMLGLGVTDLQLVPSASLSTNPALLFASLRSDFAYDTKSLAFLDAGGLDYGALPPLTIETKGAHAVDAYDVDGDGLMDLVFASYGRAVGSYMGDSLMFLSSPSGWYGAPYHVFKTTGAMDVAIEDLNRDGYADVVFAQERDASGPQVHSALYWGSSTGWNDTPDVEFATTGASAVEPVDLDGDGWLDLVFACYQDDDFAIDSMVFYQDGADFCGTVPSERLATVGARNVDWGDLDGDGNPDLVFANSFNGTSYAIDSYVYLGKPGRGFEDTPVTLPTLGATDVEVADLDGDSDLDVVFVNYRNETGGYVAPVGIYVNDGTGRLTETQMHGIVTDGAYAVAAVDLDGQGVLDLVFACRNNGTGYAIPSVVYLGSAGSWPFEPSILLDTAGAVDVLPVSLSDPDMGGYLSRAITPDPKDDVGAFNTLRCEAVVGTGQSATIAIVDAVTLEVLAQFPLSSGSLSWDVHGQVSYRDHPSVRVLVSVQDLLANPGFTIDDLWLNWTGREPAAPEVISASLSGTSIHRTESVQIVVDVSDEFDAPEELQITIEHRLEGATEWDKYLVHPPVFSEGQWTADVVPNRYAPLGVYTFRVSAMDSDGLVSDLLEIGETLEVLPNLLGPPILLDLVAEDSMISVVWRGPLNEGDLPPNGYRVLRGTTEGDLQVITSTDPETTSYTDTGLANGQTYYYAVQAFNDLGDSPFSDILNATPLGIPGAPQNLTAVPGDGTVTLSWEPPLDDGGGLILGYFIMRKVGTGPSMRIDGVGGTSYEDTDLVNGQTYEYRVGAIGLEGDGPETGPVSATPATVPDAPGEPTVQPGIQSIVLVWDAPVGTGGLPLTGFAIYRGTDAGSLTLRESVAASVLQFVDADVVVGTTYHYAIAAINGMGEGMHSPTVSGVAVDVPGVPGDLVAEAGDGSVTLTWSAPGQTGGTPITGYVVMRGIGTSPLAQVANLGDVTSFVDAAVTNGVTYTYAVIAVNAQGQGERSTTVEATPQKPTSVPGKVASLTLSVKDTRVFAVWSPPTEIGGTALSGYVVLRGDSPTDMEVVATLGLVTSYTDNDVERGRTYYYSVAALNAVGRGEAYSAQKATIEDKSEEGFEVPWTILAVVIVVIVVVALAALMLGRRRQGGPMQQDDGYPEEPSSYEPSPEDEDEVGTEAEPHQEIVIEERTVR